ncbi:MAG: DUF2786 domain-containing protein, partial [Ornithinimicrobium sp.]
MGRRSQQRRRAKATQGTGQRSGPGASFFGAGSEQVSAPRGPRAQPPPEEGAEARRLVADLLNATHSGHQRLIDEAASAVIAFSAAPSGQFQTSVLLGELFGQRLTWAWEHGWEPADLFRFAERQLGASEVSILGDAVVTDLARYAASTVDRRWFAQLQEAGASKWWIEDIDALRARAARAPTGWLGVCEDSARLLTMLARIPALQIIGPAPGKATPRKEQSAAVAAVDERLLTRVRLLLAKAESTNFEAEAETFTAGAQKLMAKHSIDVAMLEAAGGATDGPDARRIGIDRPYENAKALLLTVVADANRCRTVWSRELGFVTVLGFAADLAAVETLFTSLLVQATQAVQREGVRRSGSGGSRTRAFRSSFLTAYASRIGERLQEVTDAETASAVASAEGEAVPDEAGEEMTCSSDRRSGERGLVRVLAQRSEAVDEATQEMFPTLKHHRTRAPSDYEG